MCSNNKENVIRISGVGNGIYVCEYQKLKSISCVQKRETRAIKKILRKTVQLIFLINAFSRQIKNNKYYLKLGSLNECIFFSTVV